MKNKLKLFNLKAKSAMSQLEDIFKGNEFFADEKNESDQKGQ